MAQQNFIKVPAKLDDTNLRGFIPICVNDVIGVTSSGSNTLRIHYITRGNNTNSLACNLRYTAGVQAQDRENLKDLIAEQSQNPGDIKTFRLVADVDHSATYAVRFAETTLRILSEITG